MDIVEVPLSTGRRFVVDVTDHVADFCSERGDGWCHAFLPHATAGLALIELGSGTETDLEAAVARILPRSERYVHEHGSTGHGGDHVLPSFVAPFLVLAVDGGRPVLGTWQRVAVIDPNRDNSERRLLLSFCPVPSGT